LNAAVGATRLASRRSFPSFTSNLALYRRTPIVRLAPHGRAQKQLWALAIVENLQVFSRMGALSRMA
jgi:hypothetical protein